MSRAKYQLLPSNESAPDEEETRAESSEPVRSEGEPVVIAIPSAAQAPIASNAAQEPMRLQEISLEPEISVHVQSGGTTTTTTTTSAPSPAELPSYTEAVRQKKLEANSNDLPPAYFPPPDQSRFPIDTSDVPTLVDDTQAYEQDIGSECMFLSAFMIAFFFNWIGFFASICLLPNAAGKYGALSGFGLSMAKWVTIVRYQEWMTNMNDFQQKLFFWLFIFLGFYLFFRGLINYMTLKYRPIASIDYSRRNRWFTFLD